MAMDKAYLSSGKIFEQVSKLHSPGLYDQLRDIKKGELIVVTGAHDHIEKLLPTLKVPYEVVSSDAIPKHNGSRVLFVNCSSYSSVPEDTKKYVTDFVREGGRLITTDWSLSFLNGIFPGKLTHTKNTGDDVVEVQCTNDIASKLIGLNYAQCHPKWWLESSSHIYTIAKGVTSIIQSKEMEKKYGSPHVMVGFSEGNGEVFHFISHLELQRTRADTMKDKKGLEEFLLNMGVERTDEMNEATVAELEAAYSTLNTLAYLCVPTPIFTPSMNSVTVGSLKGAQKSIKLLGGVEK